MCPLRDIFTFYDPTSRVWSGLPTGPIFNTDQSVGELVFRVLGRNRNKIVQISADSGTKTTGGEMCLRMVRIAQNLAKMGYNRDEDIFAMAVRNWEHTAAVAFACFALGIPVNTLDPTFKRDDLNHMLSTVQPKLVFCDSDTLQEMLAACEMSRTSPRIIVMGDRVDGFLYVEELLVPTGIEENFVPVHFANPAQKLAVLVCSSGTTGRPKAVCLSHSICIAHVANFFESYSTDTVFAFSSLYWLSGLMTLLDAAVSGATRIVTSRPFCPRLAMDIVERFKVSAVFFPPSQAFSIVHHPNAAHTAFSHVRLAFCGGGSVSPTLKESFEKLIPGRSLEIGYGLSEIAYVVTVTKGGSNPSGSVGFTRAGIEIKIVDDEGKALQIGQEGEVVTRAKYVFLGYYGNKAATEEMLDNEGWLHTGDIGRFDEDGLLYIVDRKKDIIKYGNFHISPSEIENVIHTVPGVVAVCVVGIAAEGNDWATALVARNDAQMEDSILAARIINEVKDKLPSYKHLRGGVYFVKELPMTSSGKILKRTAKEIVTNMRQVETH